MDEGFCIFTELERIGEDGDSSLSKVEFRKYDKNIDEIGLICLVHEFCKSVHKENHNKLIDLEGRIINHVQALILEWDYWLSHIVLAIHEREYVGFMVYDSNKDVVGYIRAMYFDKKFKHKNLAWGFINVLVKLGIKKVLATSYDDNLEFKESRRKKLIAKKDGLNFWDIDLSIRGKNEFIK